MIDDWNSAYAVVEHLAQQGCRRIAVLAGTEGLLISQQRVAGYQQALKKHRLEARPEWVRYNNFQPELTAALADWLALPEPPDAIFAVRYSDAFDVMLGLKQRGLRIPDDMAVVGFGDEFLASMIEPGLTPVNLHPYRIGQQAARLFLEQMELREQFRPRTYVIQGELMVRQSSRKIREETFRLSL